MIARLALFAASGAAGVLYEVVWSRQLTLVFGATTLAVSTVLTTFMLGLGLGGFLGGRWLERRADPLRLYALLELGVAAYAALFPGILWLVDQGHAVLFGVLYARPLPLALARFTLTTVALLPPTLLMGATVPVMGRVLIRDPGSLGARGGYLYALNTVGAAAGSAVGGFFLVPAVGFCLTTWIAAATNLLVALAALRLAGVGSRVASGATSGFSTSAPLNRPDLRRKVATGAPPLAVALGAYAVSGFVALAYEVVLTRLLILVYGTSVYSFSVVLTGFLLGIGVGSLLAARVVDRVTDLTVGFGLLQGAIGLGILLAAPVWERLPETFVTLYRATGGSWAGLTGLEFVVTLGLVAIPTLAMGAMFPAASRVAGVGAVRVGRIGGIGRALGTVYAVNTAGSVLGAFAGGFVLIPLLGLQRSLLTLALVSCLLSAFLVARSTTWTPGVRIATAVALAALPVAALVGLPRWDPRILTSGAYVYAPEYAKLGPASRLRDTVGQYQVLYYREGLTATVAVLQRRGRLMRVNGKTDASDGVDNLTQRLLAHLPLLVAERPKDVLVIGLGTGMTPGAALKHPIDRLDVVEISPEVVEASRFFDDVNDGALQDPRTRLLVLDGRTWLRAGSGAYDVIVSEPSNPWQVGNSNLFTREHHEATRARLRPGGVVCQWLPLYGMTTDDLRTALRTFRRVFPAVSLWVFDTDVLMLGSLAPIPLDMARLRERLDRATVRSHLAEVRVATPAALLGHFLLDSDGVARLTAGAAPLHTDDHPVLEFSGPKTLFHDEVEGNVRAMEREALEAVPLANTGGAGPESAVRSQVAREFLSARFLISGYREARRAVELDSRSASAHQAYGLALAARGELPSAVTALQEAIRLDPTRGEISNDLGGALDRLGRPDDAIAAFRQASALGYGPALYNLGILYLRAKQDPARAREAFEQSIRQGRGGAEAWNALGAAHVQLQDYRRAREAWEEALRIDPTYSSARQNLQKLDEVLAPRP